MSTQQPLIIETNVPWQWTLTVNINGVAQDVTLPVLEMRRENNHRSLLIARFATDSSGNGTITIHPDKSMTMALTEDAVKLLPVGRGFWQLKGLLNGVDSLLNEGTVEVRPRVIA